MKIKVVYNDGGRSKYYEGVASDCVVRAIAIATSQDYKVVYEALRERMKAVEYESLQKFASKCGLKNVGTPYVSPRNGVNKSVYGPYLSDLGWKWTPLVKIGTGCKVHLRESEVLEGRIIVRLSKHIAAVINKEIHDTYDCSRDGTRCVYGYWSKE